MTPNALIKVSDGDGGDGGGAGGDGLSFMARLPCADTTLSTLDVSVTAPNSLETLQPRKLRLSNWPSY